MRAWPFIRLILWCLLAALPAGTAAAGDRVALLIGNSQYGSPDLELANPVNDARALGVALEKLGFATTIHLNADASTLRTALSLFGGRARGAEIALFFFAGHGVQFGGDNLLIGVDFVSTGSSSLATSSLSMREIKATLEDAAPDAGLILLDACRDAPFGDDGIRPGLVRTGGGAGLLVAYATDPGNVAYDGEGRNSVFTRALLDHVETPDLDVRLMLGRVRQQVVLDTFGQQVPWVEEALIGEHRLGPALHDEAPAEGATELALWRSTMDKASPDAFRSYLETFPDGTFAPLAGARLVSMMSPLRAETPAVWQNEDQDRLGAALAALGYLPADRSIGMSSTAALSAYLHSAPRHTTPNDLYIAAEQSLASLAAATAQQLRTDLVALRSVDRLLKVSKQALVEIEELATRNADALPVLRQARRDYEGIERSRRVILHRLDQSRSYYAELIALARKVVLEAAGTLGDRPDALDGAGIDHRVRKDVALFLDHVANTTPDKEGSYSWLADFLRQG